MLTHAFLVAFLALLPAVLLAFPTKPGSCTLSAITEGHGTNSARPCPTCYTLTITRAISPPSGASGNTFNVVLNGNNPVKGLQMWVQDSATNVTFGSWLTYPTYTAPYVGCGGINPSTNMIAHSAAAFKKMPLNFVWSDLGYKSSSSKTKRSFLDDSLFENTRPGMKEEIQAALELEKRALPNPGTAIGPSAIPAPVTGKPTQATTTRASGNSTSTAGASPSTTPNGTASPPVDLDWSGVMLGLVVVDFSDWFFIRKASFNSATSGAAKPGSKNSTLPGGGDNSTPDGSSDDTSGDGFFIVDPSAILSKNHMLYVALGLSFAFFASGWGVEVFMGTQERTVRKFAKKWNR